MVQVLLLDTSVRVSDLSEESENVSLGQHPSVSSTFDL